MADPRDKVGSIEPHIILQPTLNPNINIQKDIFANTVRKYGEHVTTLLQSTNLLMNIDLYLFTEKPNDKAILYNSHIHDVKNTMSSISSNYYSFKSTLSEDLQMIIDQPSGTTATPKAKRVYNRKPLKPPSIYEVAAPLYHPDNRIPSIENEKTTDADPVKTAVTSSSLLLPSLKLPTSIETVTAISLPSSPAPSLQQQQRLAPPPPPMQTINIIDAAGFQAFDHYLQSTARPRGQRVPTMIIRLRNEFSVWEQDYSLQTEPLEPLSGAGAAGVGEAASASAGRPEVSSISFLYESDIPFTPRDWQREVYLRLGGKSRGKVDIHFIAPEYLYTLPMMVPIIDDNNSNSNIQSYSHQSRNINGSYKKKFRSRGELESFFQKLRGGSGGGGSGGACCYKGPLTAAHFDYTSCFCVCHCPSGVSPQQAYNQNRKRRKEHSRNNKRKRIGARGGSSSSISSSRRRSTSIIDLTKKSSCQVANKKGAEEDEEDNDNNDSEEEQEGEEEEHDTYIQCSYGKSGCNGWVHPSCVGMITWLESHHYQVTDLGKLPPIICPFCYYYLLGSQQLHLYYPEENYLYLKDITTSYRQEKTTMILPAKQQQLPSGQALLPSPSVVSMVIEASNMAPGLYGQLIAREGHQLIRRTNGGGNSSIEGDERKEGRYYRVPDDKLNWEVYHPSDSEHMTADDDDNDNDNEDDDDDDDEGEGDGNKEDDEEEDNEPDSEEDHHQYKRQKKYPYSSSGTPSGSAYASSPLAAVMAARAAAKALQQRKKKGQMLKGFGEYSDDEDDDVVDDDEIEGIDDDDEDDDHRARSTAVSAVLEQRGKKKKQQSIVVVEEREIVDPWGGKQRQRILRGESTSWSQKLQAADQVSEQQQQGDAATAVYISFQGGGYSAMEYGPYRQDLWHIMTRIEENKKKADSMLSSSFSSTSSAAAATVGAVSTSGGVIADADNNQQSSSNLLEEFARYGSILNIISAGNRKEKDRDELYHKLPTLLLQQQASASASFSSSSNYNQQRSNHHMLLLHKHQQQQLHHHQLIHVPLHDGGIRSSLAWYTHNSYSSSKNNSNNNNSSSNKRRRVDFLQSMHGSSMVTLHNLCRVDKQYVITNNHTNNNNSNSKKSKANNTSSSMLSSAAVSTSSSVLRLDHRNLPTACFNCAYCFQPINLHGSDNDNTLSTSSSYSIDSYYQSNELEQQKQDDEHEEDDDDEKDEFFYVTHAHCRYMIEHKLFLPREMRKQQKEDDDSNSRSSSSGSTSSLVEVNGIHYYTNRRIINVPTPSLPSAASVASAATATATVGLGEEEEKGGNHEQKEENIVEEMLVTSKGTELEKEDEKDVKEEGQDKASHEKVIKEQLEEQVTMQVEDQDDEEEKEEEEEVEEDDVEEKEVEYEPAPTCLLCERYGGILLSFTFLHEGVSSYLQSDSGHDRRRPPCLVAHLPCLHFLLSSALLTPFSSAKKQKTISSADDEDAIALLETMDYMIATVVTKSIVDVDNSLQYSSSSSSLRLATTNSTPSTHTSVPSPARCLLDQHLLLSDSPATSRYCLICGGHGGVILRCLGLGCQVRAHIICTSFLQGWQPVHVLLPSMSSSSSSNSNDSNSSNRKCMGFTCALHSIEKMNIALDGEEEDEVQGRKGGKGNRQQNNDGRKGPTRGKETRKRLL